MSTFDDDSISDRPRWAGAVASGVIRGYLLILLATGVSGYYSFDLAKSLKLNTDIVSLMPEGVPSVDNLQRVIEKTGGYANVMVLVESTDPDAALRFLDDLRDELLQLDWVSSAEYAEDTAVFQRNRLLYVDVEDLRVINERLAARIDYEKKNITFSVEDTPVEITIRGAERRLPSLDFQDIKKKYEGEQTDTKKQHVFRNESGDLTIMVVLPRGSTTNVSYSREVIADIDRLARQVDPASYHPEMTVLIGGRVKNLVAKFDAIMSDIRGSGLWSIASILLVVVIYYRRLMAILYIGLPLVIAFLWTFGITQVYLGGLNLITIFLVLILFGLGIDFGIHNLARYDEVRRDGGTMRDALETVYSRTGRASLLAGVTTVVGFYSLMTTDFRAFYEFGFIAGTGVALALVSMYLVFPSLMVLAEKTRIYRVMRRDDENAGKTAGPMPFALPIIIVGTILCLVSIMLVPQLRFEDDFDKINTQVREISSLNGKIKQVFPLRSDRAVVFVDTLEDVSAVVQEVERIKQQRPPEEATIEKVKSIYSVVPSSADQEDRLREIERIDEQIREAVEMLEQFGEKDDDRKKELQELRENFGVSALQPKDLPPALQQIYTGVPGSGGYLVYIFNLKPTSKLEDAQAFVDDIREIRINGKTYHPATEAMVFVDMLNLMKDDATGAVAAVLAAICLVLLLATREFKSAVLVLIPVLVGMLWMLAIMAALGIRLNIFNMVVLPTVLGIGIDNGIHIYHRFCEEGRHHVRHVIRTTGGAAFLTTLTTMLGFAGTLTASNQGLQSLGLVACIGLFACMISSLTVFPALLQSIERRS